MHLTRVRPHARLFDPDHSENEDRWITLGLSEKTRLLVVIHTFLEKTDRNRYDKNYFQSQGD